MPTTLVNIVTVRSTSSQADVLASLRHNTESVIMTLKGWISTTLVASNDGAKVVIYSQWDSAEAIEAMRTDARMMAYFPHINELATFDSMVGTIVMSHQSELFQH